MPGSFPTRYGHSQEGDSAPPQPMPPTGRGGRLRRATDGRRAVLRLWGRPCDRGEHNGSGRAGMALHFLNESVASEAHGLEGGAHPYLSGPKATAGVREYGVQAAGTWDDQVARLA